MRVAMVMEPLWHTVPGGTGVYTRALASALDARPDVAVTGVSARHRRPPEPGWESPVPVRPLRLPRAALYEAWARGAPGATPEGVVPDADLVHATTIIHPTTDRPLVVTVHDLVFRNLRHGFSSRVRRLMARSWERVLAGDGAVVAPSRMVADEMVALGLRPDRAHVVPEGVDAVDVTADDIAAVRARHRLERPFVLWVGTIEPRKNLPAVLRAFSAAARTHDADLVLVGPDGWGDDLSTMVETSGAPRGRVRPLGFVDRRDLVALYAAADVFCWPTLAEGFGLPVVEAMSQGTAVVTSAGTPCEEIVGEGGIVVDPRNELRLGAAVSHLLRSPEARTELGEAGRRRAARYTWERAADLTRQVYEHALDGAR